MPPPRNSSLGRGLGDLIGGVPQTIGVAGVPQPKPAEKNPETTTVASGVTEPHPGEPHAPQNTMSPPPEPEAVSRDDERQQVITWWTPPRLIMAFVAALMLLLAGFWTGSKLAGASVPPVSETGAVSTPTVPAPAVESIPPVEPAPAEIATQATVPAIDTNVFQSLGEEGVKIVSQDDGSICLRFENPLFTSRAVLDADQKELLKHVGTILAQHAEEWEVTIVGHTDSVPLKNVGGFRDNQELGLARATEVIRVLWREAAVPMSMIGATSAGDVNPPYPGDDAASRRKNRTVTMIIEPK